MLQVNLRKSNLSDSQQSEISESPDSPTGSAGTEPGESTGELTALQLWISQNREKTMRLSIAVFVVGFVIVGVILWLTDSLNMENVGYGGGWIVSFMAAGSIIKIDLELSFIELQYVFLWSDPFIF